MKNPRIYPAGTTKATACAARYLGQALTTSSLEDATHLLLDVPLGQTDPDEMLRTLPRQTVVIGGNLHLPENPVIDLLTDESYLAENAAITAHCAIKLGLSHLPVTLDGCPVLILGWGRIGKCLGKLLQAMGAEVTIAARNPSHRAMLQALGYRAVDFHRLPGLLPGFRLIYNTVPAKILSESAGYGADTVAIELSSIRALPGDAIDGRRLPGRLAPESSGKLIAQTIMRKIQEDRV